MYLNNIEEDFVEFYLLKYRDFAKDLETSIYNINEELLRNSLRVYYRLFGDEFDLEKFNDIISCGVQCKKYVTDFVKTKSVSELDRKEKNNIYNYFEFICGNKDYYMKNFSNLRSFVENIMY